MKIMSTKNTAGMVLGFCAALLLMAPGCGTGQVDLGNSGSSASDPIEGTQVTFNDPKVESLNSCDSTLVVPDGMHSYFRFDNSLGNSSELIVRQMLHEPIMDLLSNPDNPQALYNFRGYGEEGTMMALMSQLDDLAVANLGIGPISTVKCAVAGFSSKAGNFCSGDPGCQFLNPDTGEIDLMLLLQGLFQEFVRDGSLMMSIEDAGPTALEDLWKFTQYVQLNRLGQELFPFFGGGAVGVNDVSVEPDLAVGGPDFYSANPLSNLQVAMNEEGCIEMSFGQPVFNADVSFAKTPGGSSSGPFLQVCQAGKFLLIATPEKIAELVARAADYLNVGNTMAAGSINTETFAALSPAPFGVAPTQLMMGANIDKLNSVITSRLLCYMSVNPMDAMQGNDPCGGGARLQNPTLMMAMALARSFLYPIGRQPDLWRVGAGVTLDNPTMMSLLFHFFRQGATPVPVVRLEVPENPQNLEFNVSTGGSSSTAGSYDLMLRVMASHSNAMYEAIDPFKLQEELIWTTQNGTEIPLMSWTAEYLLNVIEIMQDYQATP